RTQLVTTDVGDQLAVLHLRLADLALLAVQLARRKNRLREAHLEALRGLAERLAKPHDDLIARLRLLHRRNRHPPIAALHPLHFFSEIALPRLPSCSVLLTATSG